MKKAKYNNGGLVARKEFKGIGSIEGNLSGNQGYRAGEVKAYTNLGGTKVTASKFKDSMGNSSTNYSLKKQMEGGSSVGVTIGENPRATYSKKLKGGFTLKAQVGKNHRSMSISKPL
jgi:hypothetical protein